MTPYYFEFNQKTSSHMNLVVTDYAKLSGGEAKYDTTPAAGRCGEVVSDDTYTSNLEISVPLAVVGWFTPQRTRAIRSWLSGPGTLRFSDSPETFYKVLKTKITDAVRVSKKHGTFTASFLCTPYEFRADGQNEYESITYNPYSLCRPTYKITGEGSCTLTVNGNKMQANVGQNLTIDTENMVAFREDGTMQNTEVTGDYERLHIPTGPAEVSISDGFILKIIPQWGYVL